MERNLALIALFTALIIALTLLPKFYLAGGVPITAQSLGLMLAGMVLGAKRGGMAALLYVVLGALGLPIFAGGSGGLGPFSTPSAGYLIGFPIAAFVTGLLMKRLKHWPLLSASAISSLIGSVFVLTLCGVIGWSITANIPLTEATILASVFIPGDLVKVIIACLLVKAIHKARPMLILSRA